MMNCMNGYAQTMEQPLAMVYMPMQVWRNVYAPWDALKAGTIFAELDLPCFGRGGACA